MYRTKPEDKRRNRLDLHVIEWDEQRNELMPERNSDAVSRGRCGGPRCCFECSKNVLKNRSSVNLEHAGPTCAPGPKCPVFCTHLRARSWPHGRVPAGLPRSL